MRAYLAVALAVTALAASSLCAQDRNLGRNLAANCANCHGTNGQSQGGMPSLAGGNRANFIGQMNAFRTGARSGPAATIMHQLAKGYSEEQIGLMADYFAAQKPAQ